MKNNSTATMTIMILAFSDSLIYNPIIITGIAITRTLIMQINHSRHFHPVFNVLGYTTILSAGINIY